MDSQLVEYLQGQSMVGGYGTKAGAQNNPYVLYNRLSQKTKDMRKYPNTYKELTAKQKKLIVKRAIIVDDKYSLQELKNKAKANGMILSHKVDGKRKAYTKAQLLRILKNKNLI